MRPLYELIARYAAIADLAFDETDDDGQVSEAFSRMLTELEDGISVKFEQCGFALRNMQAMEEALAAEASRLAKRKQRVADKIDRLKAYLKQQLEELGETKYQAGIFKYSICNNGGFPSVNVLDKDAIPEQFWIPQEPLLDKRMVCEITKDGGTVPGVELVRGNHLRVT